MPDDGADGRAAATVLAASARYLYLGFNRPGGARVFRTSNPNPSSLSDFTGQGGCVAGSTGCQGLGGDGFGDSRNARFFDARVITDTQGSTARLRLGRRPLRHATRSGPRLPHPGVIMPTVLIVDDEPVILRVLARFLDAPGRTVLTAASAAEALELARTQGPIDVALLDKNLGDRSGLELARDLRRLDALTAVVLITGYASFESAVEAVQIGAYDYVTKPVDDFDGLALKVANALEKVRLAREHERISAQLAKSEARYRELFDAAPDALIVIEVGSSRICEVNAPAAAMFERDRADLVGARPPRAVQEAAPRARRLAGGLPSGRVREAGRRDLPCRRDCRRCAAG